jgi:peroxidase
VIAAAHTIGRSHCRNIANRLYNFPGTKDGVDPTLNKAYAKQLKKQCPPGSGNTVLMDPSLGGQTFDTNYYANLFNNAGLFKSDEALLTDGFARGIIQGDVNSQSNFFADFGASMEKMGRIGVLTPLTPFTGNIRKNCHRFNLVGSSKTVKMTTKKSSKKTSKKTVKSTTAKKTVKKTVKKSSKKSSKKN